MNALLALLGVAVGAILTFLLTRSNEREKHYRLLQTTAYSDYLCGVAEAAHMGPNSDPAEIFARLADSKTRICLYGSEDVIALLSDFEREGAAIGNAQQRQAFLNLVQAMRLKPTPQVSNVGMILFRDDGAT